MSNALNFDYGNSSQFTCAWSDHERAEARYRGVTVTEFYSRPWHWGNPPKLHYVIDLVLPLGSYDCLSTGYYAAEGYGVPVLPTKVAVLTFIDSYLDNPHA